MIRSFILIFCLFLFSLDIFSYTYASKITIDLNYEKNILRAEKDIHYPSEETLKISKNESSINKSSSSTTTSSESSTTKTAPAQRVNPRNQHLSAAQQRQKLLQKRKNRQQELDNMKKNKNKEIKQESEDNSYGSTTTTESTTSTTTSPVSTTTPSVSSESENKIPQIVETSVTINHLNKKIIGQGNKISIKQGNNDVSHRVEILNEDKTNHIKRQYTQTGDSTPSLNSPTINQPYRFHNKRNKQERVRHPDIEENINYIELASQQQKKLNNPDTEIDTLVNNKFNNNQELLQLKKKKLLKQKRSNARRFKHQNKGDL